MFGKITGDEATEPCVSIIRTSTDFCPVNFITVNVFLGVNQQLLSLNAISQRDSYTWSPGNRRGRVQPRSRPHVPLAASSLTEPHCLGQTLRGLASPCTHHWETHLCLRESVCNFPFAKRADQSGMRVETGRKLVLTRIFLVV